MADRTPKWGLFWGLFALGWALFAFLVATNGMMATETSPRGILDHQVAGTAAKVDAIQAAWAHAGHLEFARMSMATDLVFIGVLTTAGLIGGAQIAGAANGALVRLLGWITAGAFLVYGLADYLETIPQLVQAMSRGSDSLAQLAATANRPKVIGFLLGHLALAAGLAGVWLGRPKAARSQV